MSTPVRWLSLANTSADPVHPSSTFGLEGRPHRYTAGNVYFGGLGYMGVSSRLHLEGPSRRSRHLQTDMLACGGLHVSFPEWGHGPQT